MGWSELVTYMRPGSRWRTKPPTVDRMSPPMHMGANQALVRSGLAWRTSSILYAC